MTNQGTPTKTKRKKKTKKRDDEEPGNERTIKSKQISPVRRVKKFKSVFYRKKTSIVSLFCCSIHVYIAGNYVARKDNLAHNFSKNLARISD
jgi:hypothetical protein